MKLGLILGYSGAKLHIDIELVKEAERLGFGCRAAVCPGLWGMGVLVKCRQNGLAGAP